MKKFNSLREKNSREYDYEGDMAKSDLRSIIYNAKTLHDMLDDDTNLAEWCQSKITLAEDYISTVTNYMRSEMNEEVVQTDVELDEKSPGLWANIHARRKKGLPPRKPGQKGYPKTLNIENREESGMTKQVIPAGVIDGPGGYEGAQKRIKDYEASKVKRQELPGKELPPIEDRSKPTEKSKTNEGKFDDAFAELDKEVEKRKNPTPSPVVTRREKPDDVDKKMMEPTDKDPKNSTYIWNGQKVDRGTYDKLRNQHLDKPKDPKESEFEDEAEKMRAKLRNKISTVKEAIKRQYEEDDGSLTQEQLNAIKEGVASKQIDEISDKTVKTYWQRAHAETRKQDAQRYNAGSKNPEKVKELENKMQKRYKGMEKAQTRVDTVGKVVQDTASKKRKMDYTRSDKPYKAPWETKVKVGEGKDDAAPSAVTDKLTKLVDTIFNPNRYGEPEKKEQKPKEPPKKTNEQMMPRKGEKDYRGPEGGGSGGGSFRGRVEPTLGPEPTMNQGRQEPSMGARLPTDAPPSKTNMGRIEPTLNKKKTNEASQLDQLKTMQKDPQHTSNPEHKTQLDKRVKMAQDRKDLDQGEVMGKDSKPIPVLPPADFAKKNPNFNKEETEQIDEISKKTIASYVKKASQDVNDKAYYAGVSMGQGRKKDALRIDRKIDKRMGNIEKASDRLAKEETEILEASDYTILSTHHFPDKSMAVKVKSNKTDQEFHHVGSPTHLNKTLKSRYGVSYNLMWDKNRVKSHTSEEVEQVDEISKAALGRYTTAAALDLGKRSFSVGQKSGKAGYSENPEHRKWDITKDADKEKTVKRVSGITKASMRLAKEDVEQIDEKKKVKQKPASLVSVTSGAVKSTVGNMLQSKRAKGSHMEAKDYILSDISKRILEAAKMKGEDPCWKDYKMIGTKMKSGKEVPNCVPKKK